MKKLVAYIIAFVVALFCAATILAPAIAGAEDIHDEFSPLVYSEETIDGVYYLKLNGDIIDIVIFSELEEPFGASSFFYFYENTAEPTAE